MKEQVVAVVGSTRYLGPHINLRHTYNEELRRRIAAMHTGWKQVTTRVWTGKLPFKFKRMLFILFCTGSLFSGMEAVPLLQTHYEAMDAKKAKLLRFIIEGKETTRKNDGEVTQSMTTAQVFPHWKLSDAKHELTTRRIRWYQGWARRPKHHVQALAAVLVRIFLGVLLVFHV